METITKPASNTEAAMPYADVRASSESLWIERHASGSLRKAKALNLSYRQLYLIERCTHDFGWGFQILPRTRITFGDALMEGDCHPLTETCWFSERLMAMNRFPDSDIYQVKYIKVHEGTDTSGDISMEGAGVVVRSSSALWIPSGHVVFAIIAESRNGEWMTAQNPC